MSDQAERRYRSSIATGNLVRYQVKISETDLLIQSDSDLYSSAFQATLKYRTQIEEYIRIHPSFRTSLVPTPDDPFAPSIIRDMLSAARKTGVGPMASVAGAISEYVGRELQSKSINVIVENGGDIYMNVKNNISFVGILAGVSPLSGRIALEIIAEKCPLGICTSSATVGHSLNFGKADAVCIISKSAVLADAAATSVGNLLKEKRSIGNGLKEAMSIAGVLGVLIVMGETMAIQGDIKIVKV